MVRVRITQLAAEVKTDQKNLNGAQDVHGRGKSGAQVEAQAHSAPKLWSQWARDHEVGPPSCKVKKEKTCTRGTWALQNSHLVDIEHKSEFWLFPSEDGIRHSHYFEKWHSSTCDSVGRLQRFSERQGNSINSKGMKWNGSVLHSITWNHTICCNGTHGDGCEHCLRRKKRRKAHF